MSGVKRRAFGAHHLTNVIIYVHAGTGGGSGIQIKIDCRRFRLRVKHLDAPTNGSTSASVHLDNWVLV